MALGAGMRLGRYEIRSKIGAGGMGEVYLAEDSRLHRKVALKVLPADLAAHRDRMRRFVHEVKAASALNRAGSMSIWRMDIDGNNPKQLTHGAYDFYPVSTIDNEWVIFSSADTGKTRKVPIDGGNPVQFSEYSSRSSTVSPKDGRVAVRFLDEQAKPRRFRIALIGPEGGAPIKVLDLPEVGTLNTVRFGQVLGWILDGHAISYIDTKGSVSNIWSQPVDGGPRKQLTDFKSDLIFSYAWSHDGKKLALARGSRISDAVLISDITNVP